MTFFGEKSFLAGYFSKRVESSFCKRENFAIQSRCALPKVKNAIRDVGTIAPLTIEKNFLCIRYLIMFK